MEPVIDHLKADHRMKRCHVLGARSDSLLGHSGLTAMGRKAAKEMEKFGAEVRGERRLDASVSLTLG